MPLYEAKLSHQFNHRWAAYTPADLDFIVPRVLELTYTAWDLKPFAEDLGYDGPPFTWDEERRALLRAELDAYYAALHRLTRERAALGLHGGARRFLDAEVARSTATFFRRTTSAEALLVPPAAATPWPACVGSCWSSAGATSGRGG